MTAQIGDYFDRIERQLLLSPVVLALQVREREERLQEGFIRLEATLSNGDLLEAFEFVVITPDGIQTLTYRLHWQREDGRLRRRWDNAPHPSSLKTSTPPTVGCSIAIFPAHRRLTAHPRHPHSVRAYQAPAQLAVRALLLVARGYPATTLPRPGFPLARE